jgi:hypothetical protein
VFVLFKIYYLSYPEIIDSIIVFVCPDFILSLADSSKKSLSHLLHHFIISKNTKIYPIAFLFSPRFWDCKNTPFFLSRKCYLTFFFYFSLFTCISVRKIFEK